MSDIAPETASVSVPKTARPAAPTAPAPAPSGPQPHNTSPLSILVGLLQSVQNAIIPALLIGFGSSSIGLFIALPAFAAIIAVGTFFSYIRWKRLTYTVGAQDIRVESGVLSRAARSVPYERIQDVSLEQKFLPRLLGLVAVKFETGAGGADDLALAYLTEDAGEELRRLVRERRDAQDEASPTGEAATARQPEEAGEALFAMDTRRLFTFGLFEFSLAVFAVLGGLLQYADSFVDFEIWDPDLWLGVVEEQSSTIAALGPNAQVVSAVFGIIALLFVGSATGMVRVFTREWGFLLERTARGFRRRRGLLTKTDVVMPIHRVQGILIGTRMIRYRFGWHGLKFVSLAQDAGSTSHVVAPFARMGEIESIVDAAGFHLPTEDADWHLASTKYRNDSMVIDGLAFLLAAIGCLIAYSINGAELLQWVAALLAGLAVFSSAAAWYSWRFKRHALDENQVMARSGLLSPQSQISTRLKLHSVEIAQGPIAQWRGYATLHLGLAGGTFAIPGVPIQRAREVRRKVTETIAATDFSELESG